MADETTDPGAIARMLALKDAGKERLERTLVWRIWERLLEIEFVDRSVALAGKAFVSFFPLVIVIAAFVPNAIRVAIFTSMTRRLGVRGDSLTYAKEAFASSDDVRRATGYLGLILTFFFASSFTTALQRVYLRAWRRPPIHTDSAVRAYIRGPVWLAMTVTYIAAMGFLRQALGNGLGLGLFTILAIVISGGFWWFTAWYLLRGEIRPRVLVASGASLAVMMWGYGVSAVIWMPNVVTRNEAQFGFFGVALSLVSWMSGAAICILIGACIGPVLAEDPGVIGRFIRAGNPSLVVPGAPPCLPPPDRELRLIDAFQPVEET